MQLDLTRDAGTATCTFGTLTVDGAFECYTMELPWLDNAHDISCIPPGTYGVVVTYSPHMQRYTPELVGVPDRADIRIHSANYPSEILGCIAVGYIKGDNEILNSRLAFDDLLPKIKAALSSGDTVSITIHQP